MTFEKAGPFAYTSAVAGDAKKGMKGTFTVKAAAPRRRGNVAAGKTVFSDTGCGACHVMKEAGTTGTVGPNLDASGASVALIVDRVTNGKGDDAVLLGAAHVGEADPGRRRCSSFAYEGVTRQA